MEGNIENEYSEIIQRNEQIILNGIFGISNPIEVGSSMAFAKYLSHVGITSRNYLLFLKIVEGNNKWVVDELISDRDPRLLFSVIRPNTELVKKAFEFLSYWHPGQIYEKVLLIILGIVEYTFHKPDDGFSLYPITITDLHNLGKFLDEKKDQEYSINEQILSILDRIIRLGEYDTEVKKSIISKHAYNIRDAFFDNTKSLLDIIPKLLLVRLNREDREVSPSKEYVDFALKINNNGL